MIRIENLTVRYGSLVAANGVTLEVKPGEVFGLVGPNGAGKTTTIKVLAGLLMPDGGRAWVNGHDVVTERDAVRLSIGYMADFFGVYDYLTVQEYLAFFGGMYRLEGAHLEERIGLMLKWVGLEVKRTAYVSALSRGMKQRLYFARALLHDPPVLILDEPASGMDPRGRAELVQTLKQLNREGKTIFISSHILSELQDLCTMVGVMEASRLVSAAPLRPDPVASRRRVVLMVVPDDVDAATARLALRPEVSDVQKSAEGLLFEAPDDDAAVSAVVTDLAAAGIRILLPRADRADLKDIFLKLTRGELM